MAGQPQARPGNPSPAPYQHLATPYRPFTYAAATKSSRSRPGAERNHWAIPATVLGVSAVAALIFGFAAPFSSLAAFFWLFAIPSVLAVLVGIVSVVQIARSDGYQVGLPLAITGIALGAVILGFGLLMSVLVLSFKAAYNSGIVRGPF